MIISSQERYIRLGVPVTHVHAFDICAAIADNPYIYTIGAPCYILNPHKLDNSRNNEG